MDATFFRILATGLPILGLIALLILAGWSLRELLSDRLRQRRDRSIAVVLGAAMGVAVGGTVVWFGVNLATFGGGSPHLDRYLQYLPIGLGIAAPVAIAAVAGYAVVVRTRLARVALIGTALGAAVMIGMGLLGGSVVSHANAQVVQIAIDRDAADLAARSSVLTLSISDLHVTTTSGAMIVSRIRMRVAVATSRDIRIAGGGKTVWPRFLIKQEGNHPMLDAPTPAGPTFLAAGSSTSYDLTFDAPQLSDGGKSRIILASTYVEPTVGNWILGMQLEDETGQTFEVTTPVVVAATP
jgi:hypothetical protein